MKGKYFVTIIIFLAILCCGCVAKNPGKAAENLAAKQDTIIEPEVSIPISKIPIYFFSIIRNDELEEAGLPQPSSLWEIAGRVDDNDRNKLQRISIDRGENIDSLGGMELFPHLSRLVIHNSKIKRITGNPEHNPHLKRLYIESSEFEDISDIVLFENLEEIVIRGKSLNWFPDLTHLEKLELLELEGQHKLIFNDLQLPSNVKTILLENCGIESMDEVTNLVGSCENLYLRRNPINKSDWDRDIEDINGTWVEDEWRLKNPFPPRKEYSWGMGHIIYDDIGGLGFDLGEKEVRSSFFGGRIVDTVFKDEQGTIFLKLFDEKDTEQKYPSTMEVRFIDYRRAYVFYYPQRGSDNYTLSRDYRSVWYRLYPKA